MKRQRKVEVPYLCNLPVVRIVDATVPDDDDPTYERWMDACLARLREIESMAGMRVTLQQAACLHLEHFQIGLKIAGAECRRLQVKQIMAEHERKEAA